MIYIKAENKKKLLLLAGTACLVFSIYPYKHIYHPHYTILNDDGPFAMYSNGYVYIGDREYLKHLKGVTENDILILDERNDKDPNMSIFNSGRILNKEIRNEVLEIICIYEYMYPSCWDRSIESMRFEWFCHNVCYYMNIKVDSSCDVDLNNKDEKKYDIEFVRRLLRL